MRTRPRNIPENTSISEMEPQGGARAKHRRITGLLLWAIGIGLYAACVSYIGWGRLRSAVAGVDLPIFLFMTAVTVAGLWVRVLKWRVALGRESGSTGAFFLSKAAGEWSPGRIGELSPLALRRHRNARMAAWIVLDRILEMGVTLGLGIVGLLALKVPQRSFILLIAILLSAALLGLLVLLTRQQLFVGIASRFTEGSLARRILGLLASISAETNTFICVSPQAVLLTVAAGCLDVWAGVLLYQAFHSEVTFTLMAAAKGVHAVASAIPFTPNATGVPYFATAVLIHEVGGVPSDVLAAAIALSVVATTLVFWLSFGLGILDVRGSSTHSGGSAQRE
ncbi:MAG: flippase-like domain-containing protein [Candidatus Hydrogenedentes bacterium]|nr:flippase-like domain-containing protein [Candidatus Hydrogenedentota bacterium]